MLIFHQRNPEGGGFSTCGNHLSTLLTIWAGMILICSVGLIAGEGQLLLRPAPGRGAYCILRHSCHNDTVWARVAGRPSLTVVRPDPIGLNGGVRH